MRVTLTCSRVLLGGATCLRQAYRENRPPIFVSNFFTKSIIIWVKYFRINVRAVFLWQRSGCAWKQWGTGREKNYAAALLSLSLARAVKFQKKKEEKLFLLLRRGKIGSDQEVVSIRKRSRNRNHRRNKPYPRIVKHFPVCITWSLGARVSI